MNPTDLNREALKRAEEEGAPAEDIAFISGNLDRHLTREEEDDTRKDTLSESV